MMLALLTLLMMLHAPIELSFNTFPLTLIVPPIGVSVAFNDDDDIGVPLAFNGDDDNDNDNNKDDNPTPLIPVLVFLEDGE